MKWQTTIDAMDFKDLLSSGHMRSKSDLDSRVKDDMLKSSSKPSRRDKMDAEKAKGRNDINKKPLADASVQSSLKQEILQLEKRLKDQLAVRRAIEQALGHRSAAIDSSYDSLMPKPAKDLIREIAVLEVEVMYLEQHLLSLYRKAFDSQTSNPAAICKLKQPACSKSDNVSYPEFSFPIVPLKKPVTKQATEHPVLRSHSDLSYRAICSDRISPTTTDSLARALQSCHSQPLSFLQDEQNASSRVISLAEYLGANIADHVPDTPNRMSEEMVRCMGGIYCKLAEPPVIHHGFPSSPASSFSSTSVQSAQYIGDMWSPHCRRESILDSRLINPFCVEGLKEFSGPYNTMVEVSMIHRDSRLADVTDLLQHYKSLELRLEGVDPRKMNNDEKTAFWINLHNALMMQAYLVYGIPQNSTRRSSLLLKMTCNVGGRSVSVDTIQGSILGCRVHCPGQWLRTFIAARMKFKGGDEWKDYTIQHPEPLLNFALCSGSHSDPAVRIYTSKKLFHQLEAAKQEYIRASVGIWNEQKILLPKLIDSYAKESRLSSQGLVETIQRHLPETLRIATRRCQQGKSHKLIQWIPHNFSFRYLLSKELVNTQMN